MEASACASMDEPFRREQVGRLVGRSLVAVGERVVLAKPPQQQRGAGSQVWLTEEWPPLCTV